MLSLSAGGGTWDTRPTFRTRIFGLVTDEGATSHGGFRGNLPIERLQIRLDNRRAGDQGKLLTSLQSVPLIAINCSSSNLGRTSTFAIGLMMLRPLDFTKFAAIGHSGSRAASNLRH